MLIIEEVKPPGLAKTLSENKLTTTTPVGEIVSKGQTGELTVTERTQERKFTIGMLSRF